MLVECTQINVKDGSAAEFEAAFEDRGRALLTGTKGVLMVRFGRGIEDPAKFMLLVGWDSMDSHNAYNLTAECTEVRQLIGPYAAGASMEHFDQN